MVELVDAACGVHEALFASVGWVGVASDVANDEHILDAVDGLLAVGLHGGLGEVAAARGNVLEADVVEFWMDLFFHGWKMV